MRRPCRAPITLERGSICLKVDLSCPLELRSYELISDDVGNTRAGIRLYNLTERRVCAFEAVAHWQDDVSGYSVAAPIIVDCLRTEPRAYFGITLSTSIFPRPNRVELNFSRVFFEDGSPEWRAGNGTIVEIAELEPLSGREQNALSAVAGEDAVRFAAEEGGIWHCVCGRDNVYGDERCARCGRSHADNVPGLLRDVVLRGDVQVETELPLAKLTPEAPRLEAPRSRRGPGAKRRLGVLLRAVTGITAYLPHA